MTIRFVLFLFIISILCGCIGPRSKSSADRLTQLEGQYVTIQAADERGPLSLYWVDEDLYLHGTEGNHYEIWISNKTEGRLEAVVSVDGRDVISGEIADFQQNRGYVLLPGDTVRIDGFRTSLSTVSAFRFAHPEDSYATQMGDGTNVGVIGVAVFDELEIPVEEPMQIAGAENPSAPAPSAKLVESSSDDGIRSSVASEEEASAGLGTGFGETVSSDASIIPFRRRDSVGPIEVISLFYDSREGLEQRGVIVDKNSPPPPSARPNPFPGADRETSFATAPR